VNNVKKSWDWVKKPVRHDPSRGYLLCENCWNGVHFDAAYRDKFGVRHAKTSACNEGGCQCGCIHNVAPRKPRLTGEGQTAISMENAITITRVS
jgi:hypothetical protein